MDPPRPMHGGEPPRRDRRESRSPDDRAELRVRVRRHLRRAGLEPFHQLLSLLAQSHFGPDATVVPHLRGRTPGGQPLMVFVVDAAHPEACADYASFVSAERAFWTTYASMPKPGHPFAVAVRPARGWCRVEALAPLFAVLPVPEETS
jgi:hypothetical protein